MSLKLFVFKNKMDNDCSGNYYFVGSSYGGARRSANNFAEYHNQKVENNINYIIKWDKKVDGYDLEGGFLPINRVELLLKKYCSFILSKKGGMSNG